MKTKYRVLEKRYTDGCVRFFPQAGDWWHGWRYFTDGSTCKGVDEPGGWLSYGTLEEAEAKLRLIIAADREIEAGVRQKPPGRPWTESVAIHPVET